MSKEQPSVIDDPSIRSGSYGAPTVITIFGPKNFLYSVPDAFCAAENMELEATALGLSSCILARGEDTFSTPEGETILRTWGIPDTMTARCSRQPFKKFSKKMTTPSVSFPVMVTYM